MAQAGPGASTELATWPPTSCDLSPSFSKAHSFPVVGACCAPDPLRCSLSHPILILACKVDGSLPILQIKTPRLRKVKSLFRGHRAWTWQGWIQTQVFGSKTVPQAPHLPGCFLQAQFCPRDKVDTDGTYSLNRTNSQSARAAVSRGVDTLDTWGLKVGSEGLPGGG